MPNKMIVNALTIDVEDYFQVSALAPHISRSDWKSIECRVERNVDVILSMMSDCGAKGTFFTLGWVAERYPEMVRRIVAQGHELASHGVEHHRATELAPAAFLADLKSSRDLLQQLAGVAVKGYRAPSFSIGKGNLWAFDAIREAGYLYSSSVYPIKHDHYGMPDAPRFAYQPIPGLTEIPITTFVALQRNWPAGGGGYFRLAPYALSRWAIERVNRIDRRPAIFYLHPWEIDPGQPRIPSVGVKTRFRHYVNLDRTQGRLSRLMGDFNWGRMDDVFAADIRSPATVSQPLKVIAVPSAELAD